MRQPFGSRQVGDESMQVAVVDADNLRPGAHGGGDFAGIVGFHQRRHPQ